MILLYIICWLLLASPFRSKFCPIPELYADIPAFYSKVFSLSGTIGCHCLWPCREQVVHEWGRGGEGSYGRKKLIRGFGREIILAHNLLCQPKDWFRVPVWLPVLQGTGKLTSMDHNMWVLLCNRTCDTNVNPASHVQTGFIHFRFHESTQIRKYNRVLPT